MSSSVQASPQGSCIIWGSCKEEGAYLFGHKQGALFPTPRILSTTRCRGPQGGRQRALLAQGWDPGRLGSLPTCATACLWTWVDLDESPRLLPCCWGRRVSPSHTLVGNKVLFIP